MSSIRLAIPPTLEIKALAKKRGFGSSSKYIMSLIIDDMDNHKEPHGFVIMRKEKEVEDIGFAGEM